jgi:hypothetical protein
VEVAEVAEAVAVAIPMGAAAGVSTTINILVGDGRQSSINPSPGRVRSRNNITAQDINPDADDAMLHLECGRNKAAIRESGITTTP